MTGSSILLIGILVFLVLVIGGVVWYLAKQRARILEEQQELRDFIQRQERGVWASATIMNVRGGLIIGMDGGIASTARYEITLEVSPPSGPPYLARTMWLVEAGNTDNFKPGQQVSVKIDQEDPTIIFPNTGWAKYIPAG